MVLHGRLFPAARNILRIRLTPQEGSHALVSSVPYERLQPEPNGLGVGSRTASGLSLIKQRLVDIKRLLHMYDYAI
jgi:hypothetical protein